MAFLSLPYCHYDKIYTGEVTCYCQFIFFLTFKEGLGKNEGNLAFITYKTQHKKALVLTLTSSACPRAFLEAGPGFLSQVLIHN